MSGPLARIDSTLTAMRAIPRRFHDREDGQHPVWIHGSSVADHLLCPLLNKDILASCDWLKQTGEERDPE